MTSCCEDAPCDTRGYNVCIENTTAVDIRFNFFYASPSVTPTTAPTLQSVTVDAGNTVCYRVNVSPGIVLGANAFLATATAGEPPVSTTYIACSVHLRAFTGPDFDPEMAPFAVVSDCSPCPVSCGFACDKKEACLPKKQPSPCKPCA